MEFALNANKSLKRVKMITIKSALKNRIRLKSALFTQSNFSAIKSSLQNQVISLRLNQYCNSIIINFDDKITNLDEILTNLNLLFSSKNFNQTKFSPNLGAFDNTAAFKNQTLCDKNLAKSACCELCNSPKKPNLLAFCAMSLTAIVVFIKEHILLSAFSPLSKTFLGAISLICIYPQIKRAVFDLKNAKFSLETFISFSLLVAIIAGEISVAYEVIFILYISKLFEEYCAQKSRKEIKKLMHCDIKKVYVLKGDIEVCVDLNLVQNGDIVVCVNGEKIGVDGKIISGEGLINEALINGRSEAVFKQKGDKVFANTIIQSGKIFIKVEATGDKTYISRIFSKIDEYLLLKSNSEILADKFAKKTLKIGTLMSLATLLFSASFRNAFSVMIVMSCPCATILGVFGAISSAIAKAAKGGILIKGGMHLENLAKCDIFCFDKTGTLTTSALVVTNYETTLNKKEFFEILLNLEHKNTHPIAKSIVKFAKNNGAKILKNVEISHFVGLGVSGKIAKNDCVLGNAKFMQKHKISLPKNISANDDLTTIYLAKNGKFAGFLTLRGEIRQNSKQMMEILRKNGVKKIVLLTGDDEKVAKNFAKEFEFDEIYCNLMPEQKAKIVKNLTKFGKVAMIGDGVNDTLAMSMADVSISFALSGCEIAIEASNIALRNSDPMDIVRVYKLSKFAQKIANENYKIGTYTNLFASIGAMFGLITPNGAGLVHIVHTGAIIANSSRINLQ